ncbi:hypothetical protein [Burkholderia glumae]|uniref:Uncharacterized protein n=1 Tax=Burkholderia glumae TaxID=337 RepID=A0AAP9Y5M8_BURGL|nr:hypothetical protein [Burkholderia glumae]AJY62286.1 hypothetical protein KS03_5862 [Burkholderia glumae LMG 2196 = ATCC 33617]PNK93207.1 hypothetical protein CEQ24_030075 [Burkholderia glumae]QPQ94668.1 hypothetical protein I6H06_29070 [Burkholderia glumae]QQM89484.1 hypothetical protein I6G78_01080 [Burkholderia glumae]UVS88719.1 hypothetical protein EFP17_02205 [Burkholderia glumae]
MASYFLSRQSAVAMILNRRRLLAPEGESVAAGTLVHIAQLEQLMRDVRLGRQEEFVLPGDPPMRIVVVN